VTTLGARLLLAIIIVTWSWLQLRHAVRARLIGQPLRLLLIDAAPPVLVWLWLTCLLSRPLLPAIIVAAMSAGLACGDAAKRRASGEPLVFTDRVLGSILFYPSLYAEVLTPATLVGAGLFVLAGAASLAVAEPALSVSPWPPLVAVLMLLVFWRHRPRGPAVLRWFGPHNAARCTLDPVRDASALGPFAGAALHTAIAGIERRGRQKQWLPGRGRALPALRGCDGPVVMLQLESFFDARRFWQVAPADLLPEFDACVQAARYHGRFETPAYGANTVRTEFATLTGLSNAALGLDSFNPYCDFARVPIDSIAWRLRDIGYHTICLHPFDGRFYGRKRVMPLLGFDTFLDIASFAPPPAGSYVPDADVVAKIESLLASCGRKTFIFAITMGNHSPWPRPTQPIGGDETLAGYLEGLRRTDSALGQMAHHMQRSWPDGILAAFGDHQPSLSNRYGNPGGDVHSTDYVVLGGETQGPMQLDIAAHRLPGLVLTAADEAVNLVKEGLLF
jgi:hypothetical protein